MTLHEGAAFREALVERVVNELAPRGVDPVIRFRTFGGVRCGVLAAVQAIGEIHPQLHDRLCEKFGMSGWGQPPFTSLGQDHKSGL